ncbi:hypothetical protein RD792_003482 [Penstemon davidsonii]|uniref:Protein FAR1-RELATED SEQUENCE n=1 Tax=Penstemon davidsonii TaxID=160366 RepID=A0ABR0DTX7_9LAMI|nr:hypothetical protein RD792_003482 [Penstemon davidsonii]
MFSKLMKRPCPIDEFEERWSELIEEYGVTNHQWILEIYSKRNQWAEAFFRGHFFAMMRSTQRAESMNSLLKQKNHAARICTRAILDHVLKEINADEDIVVQSMSLLKDRRYQFQFSNHTMKNPRSFAAIIDLDESKFECECLMLQSDGIPCRHIIRGFKNMRISTFPEKSINPRWFVEVGKKLIMDFPFPSVDKPKEVRFAKMNMECMHFSKLSSQKRKPFFDKSINVVRNLTPAAEDESDALSESDGEEILKEFVKNCTML